MCAEPGTSPAFLESRYTSYRAILSSDRGSAFHITCTVVAVPASAVTPVGAPGARPSPPPPVSPGPQAVRSRRRAHSAPDRRRAARGAGRGGRGRAAAGPSVADCCTAPPSRRGLPGAGAGRHAGGTGRPDRHLTRLMVRTNMPLLTRPHQEGRGECTVSGITYAAHPNG